MQPFSSAKSVIFQSKHSRLAAGLVVTTLTILIFSLVSNVLAKREDRVPNFGKHESMLLYPTAVTARGWVGYANVLQQNLSEDAIYQKFNKNKAAYLPLEDEEVPGVPVITTPATTTQSPVEVTPDTATSTATTQSTTTFETNDLTDQGTPTVEIVSEETAIETEVSNETLPIIETTPESEPTVTGTTSYQPNFLNQLSANVSGFFRRMSETFALVHISTTTNIAADHHDDLATTTGIDLETSTSSESDQLPTLSEEPLATSTIIDSPVSSPTTTATDTASTTATSSEAAVVETIIPVVVAATSSAATTTAAAESITDPAVDIESADHVLTVTDFEVPELSEGQYITGAQLRLSLAAQLTEMASGTDNYFEIIYRTETYEERLGKVVIENEISNALNGGYYLFALPETAGTQELGKMTIDVVFRGDLEEIDGAFVDAIWLEVNTKVFTRADLEARVDQAALAHLRGPRFYEFISTQTDFSRFEVPLFHLRYQPQRNAAVRAVRELLGQKLMRVKEVKVLHQAGGELGITPEVTTTKDGLLTLAWPEGAKEKMKPGRYTVELTIREGGVEYQDSFDFQWGILALNPDQTTYEKDTAAQIFMGALTPNGNTLCDANLWLYVIDPDGLIDSVPVEQSGQCFGNNVTDVPDYQAAYTPRKTGTYELYLERLDEQGDVIGHTSDTIKVVDNIPVTLARTGPTRIFPPAPYPMEITLTAKQAFTGELIELVPASFVVFDTDALVSQQGDQQELRWPVSMMASTTKTFSYRFDAPDLSPYLYELGPATLHSDRDDLKMITDNATNTASSSPTTSRDFTEHRQWQIASDATGNMIVFWDNASSIPAGWSCLSCGSGTFYQNFVIGSSTYNNTGGAATHTHTANGSVLATSQSATESGTGAISTLSHTHTYTPTISTESNLPSYRQLRVIQYTASAGEPASIPNGAIGIFDATVPSGWTQYSAQDGYYIRGEDTPGTTGGSNTSSHTISGTTGGSSGGGTRVRGGGSQVAGATDPHTHSVSGNTTSISNEPPYIEVILGQINSTSTAPNGLIAMWTDTVPSGWVDRSSSASDPFYNRFIKASTSYGFTSGSSTHTHVDETGITSAGPSATTNGRSGSAGASGSHTHSVSVTGFDTVSHMPPYVSAIFGKRQGTDPVYEQLSYRWYANETAQTPTDPWPSGVTDLTEGEAITATSTPLKDGDIVRLRMNVAVTNATATAGTTYKLQYGAGGTCSSVSDWTTVGDTASSTLWRGYDNSGVADHGTLSSTTLASSTVAETYEENGYATNTPNQINPGAYGEWDFVLEHNGAAAGTQYCFRMVESDLTAFATYTDYPALLTNAAPSSTLSKLFDNEKTASTTPWFQFVATDDEGEDVHYQIQIDDDYGFGSTVVDKNTVDHSSQFENQIVTSDKAPFNQGELIEFTSQTVLSNGTTYYWRVRARDPDGSAAWGDWSTIRSFTVDTTLTVTAWFQTQDEQFDTNSLNYVATTGSDSVDLTSVPDVSILDGFTTGATKTVSAGTNRLLVVGIHSEDSGTNVDVDTVTYGGQTLTEVYDEQVGGGFSNGMWVGYLNEAGIASAVSTTIAPTWNGGTPDETVLYSSVVFENVDQDDPVPAFSANSGSSVSTIQPTTTIAVSDGDYAAYFTVSGSGGETHTAATGYTEGTEEDVNSVAANASKAITSGGTEQPTADWTNTQNRLAIVALTISKYGAGTMTSTPIDFDDGTLGTAWGELSFNDTETVGDIKYQIQYLTDAATWSLIPDSDLSGNSTGFDTSPVNLLNLETDTYNEIRVVGNFTDIGGSPSLEDWTIEWGYRVETPTISKLFPNEKTATTTPTFEFVTSDPQNDSLTYQVSWSTDNTFAASTTRTSDTDNGFVNIDTGADTDPFNSGDTIQFTIQGADALTNNNTYWWRVRAKDTTGDDAYSLWTTAQSFTVDTTVTVSTWFQTTEEQFDTDILSGTVSLASDAVSVATTATEAMIVYGEGTETTPRYRQWDGTEWGSEGSLSDIGAAVAWAVVKAGTAREEYVAATVGTDNDVNVQVFSTGAWSNLQELTTSMGDINARGFDVAYETLSGDALVAYCDGDADPSYYVWDGSSWTSGGTINLASANNCEWIELASDPVSDEIIILSGDDSGSQFEAQVWSGSAWGNSTTQGSITDSDHKGMDVVYEESGGQAIIVTSDGNPGRFRYNTWNGTTWGTASTQVLGDDLEWVQLAADVGTDEVIACYLDEDSDVGVVRWTGSAWAGQTELDVDGNAKNDPPFSCVFEDVGSRDNYIMTAYSDTAATNYSYWNNSTWSTEAQINTLGDSATMELERTGVGTVLGLFFDDVNDTLNFSAWDGTAWSTTTALEDDASVDTTPFGHPYDMTPRNAGKDGTTIVSPGINFTDGLGPYWQEMSWVDTTPGSSDILYSVQYYDSASSSWKFIPDSDLPGNAAGTSTSPIDLSSLDKNIYSTIRPYAALSCDGSNNCPTLNDWTVEWAEGITISGTILEYDQATNVTSGTVAVAVNGSLQVGKTSPIVAGTWSISNVTTFAGDTVTVFVTGAADANEAVTVSEYDGNGNMTDVLMYERHLVVGTNDATTTTNTEIGHYDYTNTEDIFLDVTGSSLNLCADTGCGDARLYVFASSTYQPGGQFIVHDAEVNGTLVATSTGYISGSWDNNATSTLTNSTLIFTATSSTETLDDTGAAVSGFHTLTFGTTTGNATWTPVTNLDLSGDLTVTRGTLDRDSISINLEGDLLTEANGTWSGIGTTTFDGSAGATWADQNSTLQNVGNVVVDGSTKTVTLAGNVAAESITIGADDTLDASASNYDLTVYGDWVNNNAFVARSGTVFFAATTSGQTITSGGDAFYDLSFNGAGGTWSFTEATVDIDNDYTIATGTVTFPTGTTTVAGSFSSAGGTFAHNNSVLYFTGSGVETITASGTALTNNFYDLSFNGSGSWTMVDTNATTSHDLMIAQGTATFPSGTLAVGGSLLDTGGTFIGNGGTVVMTSSGAETIQAGGSSFSNLTISGSGSWTIVDTNATVAGDLSIDNGTLTLPSGTLTIGGSLTNNSTLTHNSGTILFNSSDAGETINTGSSELYDVIFNSLTGGWTITNHATATNDFTLATSSSFTLSSGQVLSVGGTFTNSVGGASTTWTGSTLSLENGTYSLNTKTDAGDGYATLRVDATADISMWNSSSTAYNIIAGGSLYSQDHSGVDGDLYIFGSYERTSGTEYWSYATDFDGTDLSGGSERLANVRFQSGATASLTNSVLEILGTSTASTTIQNQGTGTYTVSVTSGTTTAQYYDFADLGLSGLSLLAGNIVTSLADGAFEPATAGATGLTVSSTTIDANGGLQIYRVNFSTTSAIAATNVTQTGGAPASYWWFRDSTGNIDGEAFDSDTGNPGSVRWDDSALNLTIAGVVYTDDGVTPLTGGTCDGVSTPVRVVIDGSTSYDGSCSNVDGSYSISGVTIVGDPTITVFLNNASGGEYAVAVTRTATADVTDLDLYVNRVITRHEDTEALSIANLAVYDSSDDSDLRFTAATGTTDTLTVFYDNELHIWATTTFTPGGPVDLNANATGNSYDGSLHIDDGATFTGAGTTTYNIGGSITLGTGATYVAASTTINMTATTSGKTINTEAGETLTVNELNFTGSGGAWNLNGDLSATADINVSTGTVTGTGDVTLLNGSFSGNGLVSFGGGTTTIHTTNTLGGTQGWTFYDLTLGNGAVTGTTTPGSTATTTISNTLTIATAHFLDTGSSVWNLSGSGTVLVENGTLLEDTSTFIYSGTAATDIVSTDYYNLTLDAAAGSPTYTAVGAGIQVLNDLKVAPTGTTTVTFDTNDTALNIDGDLTIGSLGTLVASDSGSFTLAGSYDNNGTYTASGGTLTFDGSGTHTIAAGNSSFSTAIINGSGDFTVSEQATATAAFAITGANDFTLASGQSLAVGGTFINSVGGADTIWTDSTLYLYGGGNYEINASTTNDTYGTLQIGSNTQIRMWNSNAATTTVDSTGSLYSQDHANVDGDLYIYGAYTKTTGIDYWSYATDFDGTDLSGGSERTADVYLDADALVYYGGTADLSVLGTAAASTTLQNQGSGTYNLTIGNGASTTMNYYVVRNASSTGLVFSGAPNVTSIAYGDYLVSEAGGSAITVGGTAINASPALTFTNVRFATSSAISAFNVTATGTSVSSWRFTNHTGNLDGEAKDVDPDGDPGYIVWDDSAASITVAGNVYSDEGSTASGACDGATSNVHLRVAGLTSYTTSCNASTGAYSISGVSYSPGDSLMVYIDGEAEVGATVSEDPVSNINNMDIYENRVIVRHESSDPLSIDDMAVWDSSDDADIPFTAVSGSPDTLTLPADTKLIVWTNKEFAPGGNVTLSGGGAGGAYDGTLEAYDGATFTAAGSEEHSIGGSMIFGSGATFTAANSTTTFTTTGASRTVDVNAQSFYNLAFTGSGSWSVTDTTLDANNLLISAGTLTLPTGTTTLSGFFNNSGGSFDANNGLVIFDAGSGTHTVAMGGSDLNEVNFNGAGAWNMTDTNATTTDSVTITDGTVTLTSGTLSVGGNFRNTGGAITHNTSELILTAATTTLLASSSDLYSVTFSANGPFVIEDNSLTLLDTLTITEGHVTLATGTMSIGGSLTATGGTFDAATGTILFNSGDTGETINPGSSSFYNVVFSNAAGGWTISADATTTNNFTLTAANDFTQQSGTSLYVGNVFTNSVGGSATTWQGSNLILDSGTEYEINTKSAGGDEYDTLTIGADTDISSWNSAATTTVVDSSGSLYSQDHNATDGSLYIYGDYHVSTTTEYWSYATDFDGTALSGGSRRVVTVSIAANATTTVDGGTLNIVGESGNETTITNQGSGTYDFNVTAGTFNALYYAYRNLNSTGLSLTGTPTISSLTQGDFELAVNGGSLISLSSTTLNANASMVITGNRFATTTAITGTNVNLTGNTTNAWTFVSHTGNLSGEDYDNDGGTACGSIRWDDSACLLTQQTHYRWRNDDGGIGVPDNEWLDVNWGKRQSVRIDNQDASAYTNPVIELTVAYDADMQADFDDLRFTDDSGTTTIDYFIASTTVSNSAEVWVEVPSLPASDTATIYMYYDNPTATTTSSSTATFIAADDFEDNNITEYSGDTSLFAVDGSFVYGGSYGLDNTGNESAKATDGIARFDQTISQGETIRYQQYIDTSAGSGDEVCTLFGVQSPVTNNQNYAVCLEQFGTDRISLVENAENTDSTGTVLASSTVSYSTGWYTVEIDWQSSDDIDVALYDSSGTLAASTTANDGTYTSGGFGFTYWFNNGGWDNYTSRLYLTTEPVVRYGVESVRNGATWIVAEDTAATTVSAGDTPRLRLAIENTGLSVTDQYLLEYAERGASPSCESVSAASYATVPVAASCGSSPVCMATSSNVANGVATTDLLTGADGTFVVGEFREDPSNITASLTVDQNEYTELEYSIAVTANVSDENLCFRVSDNGSDLDTYLRVAALEVRFDPSFGAVTLNGGNDITLTPGATTTVYATGTATDLNGYADLVTASSTIYRSGAGAACAADDNNCYISAGTPQCTFTNCAGNSCVVSCYADIYYHADPTDAAPYEGEEWLAYLEVEDQAGGTDLASAPGVELLTLRALDVTNTINYGSLEVANDTGSTNATTTIENQGNDAIDVQIVGSDLSDGDTSTIDADQQIFATSTFTYSTCTDCTTLATTSINYEVDLSKPTTTTPATLDDLYWGIAIPFGTASNPHSGNNTFYAIGD